MTERAPAPELSEEEAARVAAFGLDQPEWEYGFYDSEDGDNHPTIWWYMFGLPHETPESAERTGGKNVWGQVVLVRRTPEQAAIRNAGGPDEYELVKS